MARKQQSLPGVPDRSPEIPELEEMFEELRIVRGERIELQQEEKAIQDKILAYRRTMTNPIEIYKYVDEDGTTRIARFKITTKVSVRSETSDDEDGGDDDAGDDGEDVSVQ